MAARLLPNILLALWSLSPSSVLALPTQSKSGSPLTGSAIRFVHATNPESPFGLGTTCGDYLGTYDGVSVFSHDDEVQGHGAGCGGDLVKVDDYGDSDAWSIVHVSRTEVEGGDQMVREVGWFEEVEDHLKWTLGVGPEKGESLDGSREVGGSQRVFQIPTFDRPIRVPSGGSKLAAGHFRLLRAPTAPSHDSAFYLFPSAGLPFIDTVFPPRTTLVVLPETPLPLPALVSGSNSLTSVPGSSVKRVTDLLANLTYDRRIDEIVSSGFDVERIKDDVRTLTGEKGGRWNSRHSFSEGSRLAAEWIKGQIESSGFDCELWNYQTGFSPDVMCHHHSDNPSHPSHSDRSDSDRDLPLIVLSAHYDSRGSFGFTAAPGADDDGSGTAMLLAVSRAVRESGVSFRDARLVVVGFSGEEQGLVGSRHYASRLKSEGEDVLLQIHADMIAYRKPDEPMQLAFPGRSALTEATWLVGNISTIYVPQLVTGITTACCSDQQSFDAQGFASTWLFERNGPIADPKYHDSGDLSDREGYDFEQLKAVSQVALAAVLEVGGYTERN